MIERKKNRAKALLRRSTGLQEKSLEQQLDWAIARAKTEGVALDATPADLAHMKANRLHAYKGLYVDDAITGSDLTRPGLSAMLREIPRDPTISHLLVYLPDRLARPEDPVEGVKIETGLLKLGVTVIFSNRVSLPRKRGVNYIADNIQLLFTYTEAGEYLNLLAQRVIEGHLKTVALGGATGGRAPYGFGRYLCDASGAVLQELKDGMKVRMPGCIVKWRPKDQAKIRTWVMILEWYFREKLGAARIARRLNQLGIPSPDAGRTRRDRGENHKVTGRWSSRTVLCLIRNRSIIGLTHYGEQSEGHHRRLGGSGPRLLDEKDLRDDGTPKVRRNDDHLVITKPTGMAPAVDLHLFEACQQQLRERGRNQRGISRRTDPSRYPLALRLWDMSDGCGHPMYARTSGNRPLYVCGKYMKSAGSECNHNAVDGAAALSFVIGTLQQLILRAGGRDALRARLLTNARAEQTSPPVEPPRLREIQRRLSAAEVELSKIQRNFARAQDDEELKLFRNEMASQKAIIEAIRCEQQSAQAPRPMVDVEQEVERALSIYDEITRLADNPAARAGLPALLDRLNLRLWLNFGDGLKGNRKIRILKGGILTLGDTEPPLRPYGGTDDGGPEAGRSDPGALPRAAGVNETPSVGSSGQPEGVSFTMVNRGD